MLRVLAIATIGLALHSSRAAAQTDNDTWAPDRAEPGSVEKIREFTTAEEYLPRSVAYIPDSDRVPSPTKVLGHIVGAPEELSSVETIHGYYRKLAEASDRVRVEPIGTSEEGREILLVTISSAENLAKLDRYRDIAARLADPRTTSRAEMEALVAEGKPFYYLLGGLHSPETGSPEMLMELAYRLAVSDKPEIRAIRDQVIVLVTPVVEVDGRDRQVQWYYRHLRGKNLPFRDLEDFDNPPYWGKYAFHDNNRDGMQLTLALTRAVHGVYYRYHPQVVHDLHESVPLLYISTGHGPYTRAADPLTVSEWTQFAYHETGALQSFGLPGVWTWGFWDGWWPGYLFSVANNHNSIGRFYETFGNSMAGTFDRELKRSSYAGKPVTDIAWYRPWPPEKKLRWSLRNNTNYMQAGVLQALEYASDHGTELLRNFWVKGDRAVQKGKAEAPYGWIFAAEQRDPARLRYLLRQLLQHRFEVRTLEAPFTSGEKTYPAGSWLVRCDQPYRNALINFLDKQDFPTDEPNPPYDDVGWTWPLLYDVAADKIDDKKLLDATVSAPVISIADAPGTVQGTGRYFLLRDTGQTALASARVVLGKATVEAADTVFTVAGVDSTPYPAGSWIVRADRSAIDDVAKRFGLEFTAVESAPSVRRHALDLPKLAVLHTWVSTQDCGWVRYTLDQAGVPYTLIHDGDLRRGKLKSRFDMILFPNSWGNFATQVHGLDKRFGPLAYTKTAEYPSHGFPDESPDITGGMGFEGLIELQRFVQEGGLLVTLANAGTTAVDGGIVSDVSKLAPGTVQSPGSELQAKVVATAHPLVYGYGDMPTIFRGNGPLWDVDERDRHLVVLQFGTKKVPEEEPAKPGAESETDKPAAAAETAKPAMAGGEASTAAAKKDTKDAKEGTKTDLLLSGFVKPKDKVDGMPAILDVPTGKGRVVLFSFNPMHRYLNHSDFRFVYNAILNWNDLAIRR